jgi:hypothetical protein
MLGDAPRQARGAIVSSNYQLICLSHDPGIPFGQEWSNGGEPLALLRVGTSPIEHTTCDLVIGRWSGALIEVCCAGGPRTSGPGHPVARAHGDDRWIKVGWLRLLAASALSLDAHVECWTRQRATRCVTS